MYEIKQMSPHPSRPRRQIRKTTPVTSKPYLSQPINSNHYIYQQSLRPNQRPIPWRLIPIDIPEITKKNVPPNPKDPRLSQDQEQEELNKQLLVELEVFSSSSESSPIQDPDDLQDHPEDWLVIDEL